MRIGYFRAGSDPAAKQELRALEEAGCDQILIDSLPASRSSMMISRLAEMTNGDELVIVRLNHLMPMPGLLDMLTNLVGRGVVVHSLADDLRTSDPGVTATVMSLGRYTGHPFAGVRKKRGRSPVLSSDDIERARQMILRDRMPVTQVAAALGVSRATLYRHVAIAA